MNAPLTKEQLARLSSDTVSYRATHARTAEVVSRPGLFSMISDAVRWVAEFPRRQAALDELSRLTDRELADIGLTRANLRQVLARAHR